jgi:hypothetical protein
MLTSVQALGADGEVAAGCVAADGQLISLAGAWDVPGGSPIFVVAQIMSLFGAPACSPLWSLANPPQRTTGHCATRGKTWYAS